MRCLPFTWKTRKFQLENQMVRSIPFGVLLKLWVSGQSDAFLFLLLGFTADVHTFCKLNHFVFMPKISIRVVCVKGKHPLLPEFIIYCWVTKVLPVLFSYFCRHIYPFNIHRNEPLIAPAVPDFQHKSPI